jgi:DNA-binding phage protein
MTNEELIQRQAQLLDDFSDRHDSDTELIRRAAERIRQQREEIESLVVVVEENAELLFEADRVITRQQDMIELLQRQLDASRTELYKTYDWLVE